MKGDKTAVTKPKLSRPKIKRPSKAVHHFELIYRGSFDAYDDIEATLVQLGREDIFLGWQGGLYRLGFAREAPAFRDALLSAIAEVECLGLGLELDGVERINN